VRLLGPDPELACPRACAVCGRQDRGFGHVHENRHDLHPSYRFCSKGCQDVGAVLAARGGGMIDKTPLEAQAIKDARRHLAEVLGELGLMAPFHDRSAEEIDRIIEACVDGFQESMQRQTLNDDLPF
jgi:hypothetical protein